MQFQMSNGRDAIPNVKHIANWEHIREQKQTRINENNKRENKSRHNQDCSLGDETLIKARKHLKHELECEGPCQITQVNDDGTLRFQKGIVNNGRIKPFHEQAQICKLNQTALITGASAAHPH